MYLKFTIMTMGVEYWKLYVVLWLELSRNYSIHLWFELNRNYSIHLWLELNRNYSIHLLLVSGTFCITCYETDLYHLNAVVPLPTIF